MKNFMFRKTSLTAWAIALAASLPCSAMTLKEFRKFSSEEKGTYIGAAVGMLAYTYAANGNVAKARCIRTWYFGSTGEPATGPRTLMMDIGVAANLDAEKYHVEGVILGAADKACGSDAPRSEAKR